MNRSRRVTVVLVLLAVAVGLVLLYRLVPTSGERPGRLQLSGNIEVTDAEVSFRIPGHVRERLVREGERVARGAVVARLESADLEHEVALRQAEAANARALLAEMTAGYRAEEVAQVRAAHAQASAELSRAESDWHRQQALFEQGLVTAREAEAARTTFEVAQGRTREARERLGMLSKGYRPEQVDQARARLQQAEEALALARTRLGYADPGRADGRRGAVREHRAGRVRRSRHAGGHRRRPRPVWLRAYIDETDLGRVKLGQRHGWSPTPIRARVYAGTVTFIAPEAEFTPKNVQTEKERVKLVYRIKIDIPNPDQELKPGMPADAELDVSGN